MTKFLNTLLILIILVAGGRLAMRGLELRAYAEERDQLTEKLDGFQVHDRSKYLVQFVENDDPMLFSWRIFTPSGLETRVLNEFGGSKGSFGCVSFFHPGSHGDASVRFDVIKDDVYFDTQFVGGAQRRKCSGGALAALCTDHWSDLDVEVFGQGEPAEVDVNQVADLLKITIPDDLFVKLKDQYGNEFSKQFPKQLFFRLGYGERGMIESIRLRKTKGTQ